MVSVVAVKSNTGSTIAIIVVLLGLAAAGYFIATRALKDFKFPEIGFPEFPNLEGLLSDLKFPEIKLPEFNFPEIRFPEFNFPDFSFPDFQDVFAAGTFTPSFFEPGTFTPSGSFKRTRQTLAGKTVSTRIAARRGGFFPSRPTRNIREDFLEFFRPRPVRALFPGISGREAARRGVTGGPIRVSRSGACISNCPGGSRGFGRQIAPSFFARVFGIQSTPSSRRRRRGR